MVRARQTAGRPAVDPDLTLKDYATRWLTQVAPTIKPRTRVIYRSVLQHHVLPLLGRYKLRVIHRGQLKALLVEALTTRARSSVGLTLAVVRACFSAAVEDGVILANPAAGLGRSLGKRSHVEEVSKALTRGQLAAFLESARRVVPQYAVLFLLLARTGLRLGEALALLWEDRKTSTRPPGRSAWRGR